MAASYTLLINAVFSCKIKKLLKLSLILQNKCFLENTTFETNF